MQGPAIVDRRFNSPSLLGPTQGPGSRSAQQQKHHDCGGSARARADDGSPRGECRADHRAS